MPTAPDDTRFGTSLPPAIQRRLRMQAAATKTRMATLLTRLLDEALMSDAEIAELVRNGGTSDDV